MVVDFAFWKCCGEDHTNTKAQSSPFLDRAIVPIRSWGMFSEVGFQGSDSNHGFLLVGRITILFYGGVVLKLLIKDTVIRTAFTAQCVFWCQSARYSHINKDTLHGMDNSNESTSERPISLPKNLSYSSYAEVLY